MEVNELRIGNYIKYTYVLSNDIEFCKVTGVKNDGRVYFFRSDGCEISLDTNEIEPIELTGDILIKNGFFKRGYNEIYFITPCVGYYEYYISYQNIKDNKYSFVASGYKNGELKRQIRLDNIKYLHELQNIFFSFTNQELEMKL